MSFESKYFALSEFQCKCGRPECDAIKEPQASLVSNLDTLRGLVARPIVITSGIRCQFLNSKAGGVADSNHLTGAAADLNCADSLSRYTLLINALKLFDRIGVGKSFVHVDVNSDAEHPSRVIWTYYE